ncbi:MaoC family dehydratase [Ornithinimicrobium ciconiae]|uniref:MaoC family dehydratase n=1 Tax=Ornithinimicrobium ciconiae TaxID=2594265 RepID=A0A516GE02_9MICO|nr:MaoC family dehydratase [Ornithinimicrobium ciconiae]QDO89757.1 MaoC family dehydratase [Ornithinimicrobium ciconiae]
MSSTHEVVPGQRTVFLADLPDLVGQQLGPSRPIVVTQERIDAFAEASGDRQWLHTDLERAARGPFGGTIAHGYLTLALQTVMLWDVLEVSDADSVVNYGLNKVRFITPVPVGSELVMTVEVTDVSPVRGGHQLAYTATISLPGASRPCCVAEVLFRYLSSEGS